MCIRDSLDCWLTFLIHVQTVTKRASALLKQLLSIIASTTITRKLDKSICYRLSLTLSRFGDRLSLCINERYKVSFVDKTGFINTKWVPWRIRSGDLDMYCAKMTAQQSFVCLLRESPWRLEKPTSQERATVTWNSAFMPFVSQTVLLDVFLKFCHLNLYGKVI